MIKKISTLLILFSTVLISGQNITLLKNFNPKVKELKHNLNTSKDTLLMACDKTIYQVEIFNEDYEKIIQVNAINTQIPLNDIPIGQFVVKAKLADKIIIMNIIKHDYTTTLEKEDIAEGKGMMLDEKLNVIKRAPNTSIAYILTREKTNKLITKKQKYYWTVIEVNSKSGSNKTMKLVNQDTIDRMILKNKLEYNNSASGKLNELTVWEVYNTSKFMKQQVSNANYMYSLTSDTFNTTPYYSTENSLQNI